MCLAGLCFFVAAATVFTLLRSTELAIFRFVSAPEVRPIIPGEGSSLSTNLI